MRFLGSTVNVKVAKYCIRMVVHVLPMHSAVAIPSKTSRACASLATKMLVELDSTALVSNYTLHLCILQQKLMVCKCSVNCYLAWIKYSAMLTHKLLIKLCVFPFQISMSVSLGLTFVMRMPSV